MVESSGERQVSLIYGRRISTQCSCEGRVRGRLALFKKRVIPKENRRSSTVPVRVLSPLLMDMALLLFFMHEVVLAKHRFHNFGFADVSGND
ncbi:MAG: hypothetical protein ABSA65_04070 [Acidimicrobiales bacterium]